MSFEIKPPSRVSIHELTWQNDQMRLPLPMPLERTLLMKRIRSRGHSGQFLADAFISSYRSNLPFNHSLGELNRLDAEAFTLFIQILHIRNVRGWSDEVLFEIEKQIKVILAEGVKNE